MDGYKLVTTIGTIVAVLAAGVSIVLGILNRRSTVRKETVDMMQEASGRRDREIERLKTENESLTRRLEILEAMVTRLEREKVEYLTEILSLRKQKARAQGRDSDDA